MRAHEIRHLCTPVFVELLSLALPGGVMLALESGNMQLTLSTQIFLFPSLFLPPS